jgi:hypothetical protein
MIKLPKLRNGASRRHVDKLFNLVRYNRGYAVNLLRSFGVERLVDVPTQRLGYFSVKLIRALKGAAAAERLT